MSLRGYTLLGFEPLEQRDIFHGQRVQVPGPSCGREANSEHIAGLVTLYLKIKTAKYFVMGIEPGKL